MAWRAFIESGQLKLWNRIYDDAVKDNEQPIQLACAAMIHNLASKPQPCALLAVNDDALTLIIKKILKNSPHDSALFANTLKGLAALMFTLPKDNKQLKVTAMGKMIDVGVLDIFNATLRDSKDRGLEELVATITVSFVQTSIPLAQRVAEGGTPGFLVRCLDRPTPQTQHVCLSIWFYVTDNYKNQTQLIKEGLLEFLSGEWYANGTKDDTVRIGLSLILKLIANTKNYPAFRPFCDAFQKLAEFCAQKGGDIAKQAKSLTEDVASVRKGDK